MDRHHLENHLAEVVHEHRFTIAVVFPIVGAIVLLASAHAIVPAPVAFNPLLIIVGVGVMRLPIIAGMLPLIDRRAAIGILVLAGYTWAIEIVGVTTGYPYGSFEYGISLGPMVQGVPLALPLFFVPLVLNAYLFALLVAPVLVRRRWLRVPVVVLFVVTIDLILDPGAVAIGFWSFDAGGAYYDVPWSNYVGWLVSGTVAVLVVEFAFDADDFRDRLDHCPFMLDDLVSFVLLWGAINVLYGNVIPVLFTLGFLGGLLWTGRLDFLASQSTGGTSDHLRG